MTITTKTDDATLVAKINEIMKALKNANAKWEKAVEVALDRRREAGLLLFEAHKLHPGRKAFVAFLKLTDDVKYAHAMWLIKGATNSQAFEKLKADNAARQQKYRNKKKAQPKKPTPALREIAATEPEPSAVCYVTDNPEASAENGKSENADLDLTAEEKAAKQSAHYLAEFTFACRAYLPKITVEADRQKALVLVSEFMCTAPKVPAEESTSDQMINATTMH